MITAYDELEMLCRRHGIAQELQWAAPLPARALLDLGDSTLGLRELEDGLAAHGDNVFYERWAVCAAGGLPEGAGARVLTMREGGVLVGLLPVQPRRAFGITLATQNWDQRIRALPHQSGVGAMHENDRLGRIRPRQETVDIAGRERHHGGSLAQVPATK